MAKFVLLIDKLGHRLLIDSNGEHNLLIGGTSQFRPFKRRGIDTEIVRRRRTEGTGHISYDHQMPDEHTDEVRPAR